MVGKQGGLSLPRLRWLDRRLCQRTARGWPVLRNDRPTGSVPDEVVTVGRQQPFAGGSGVSALSQADLSRCITCNNWGLLAFMQGGNGQGGLCRCGRGGNGISTANLMPISSAARAAARPITPETFSKCCRTSSTNSVWAPSPSPVRVCHLTVAAKKPMSTLATRYRNIAAKVRAQAGEFSDEPTRQGMLTAADVWDRLAALSETSLPLPRQAGHFQIIM